FCPITGRHKSSARTGHASNRAFMRRSLASKDFGFAPKTDVDSKGSSLLPAAQVLAWKPPSASPVTKGLPVDISNFPEADLWCVENSESSRRRACPSPFPRLPQYERS